MLSNIYGDVTDFEVCEVIKNTKYLNILRMNIIQYALWAITLPIITCSKLTIETLEQGVKYVQN